MDRRMKPCAKCGHGKSLHLTHGCPQDKVAVAWLSQVRREAAVKALWEAADDMDARYNKNELIARADRWEGYYSGVLSSIMKESSALRARADRMETEKLLLD